MPELEGVGKGSTTVVVVVAGSITWSTAGAEVSEELCKWVEDWISDTGSFTAACG